MIDIGYSEIMDMEFHTLQKMMKILSEERKSPR